MFVELSLVTEQQHRRQLVVSGKLTIPRMHKRKECDAGAMDKMDGGCQRTQDERRGRSGVGAVVHLLRSEMGNGLREIRAGVETYRP